MVTLHFGHLKRMSHIVCFDIDFFQGKTTEEKKNSYVKWFPLQSLGKSGVMMVGS
jgi:hypothetical protein